MHTLCIMCIRLFSLTHTYMYTQLHTGGASHHWWWPGHLQPSADTPQDVHDGSQGQDPPLVHIPSQPQCDHALQRWLWRRRDEPSRPPEPRDESRDPRDDHGASYDPHPSVQPTCHGYCTGLTHSCYQDDKERRLSWKGTIFKLHIHVDSAHYGKLWKGIYNLLGNLSLSFGIDYSFNHSHILVR